MQCIRPIYFNEFQCDGKICGSRCCTGWRVTIDGNTYAKYQSIADERERKEILSQLERLDEKNYFVKMNEQMRCPFVGEDYLCKIQKKYGEGYLSMICHSYPRISYRLGDILEQSLTLTCPIAARLVLLPTLQMEFEEVEVDEPRGFFDWSSKVPLPIEEAIGLQATAISILQDRHLSIDARLLKLCLLFRDDEVNVDEPLPYFDVEGHASAMIEIFKEMYETNIDNEKKNNLKRTYLTYYKVIISRLMNNYAHIFENYLVNEFFMRCYPFAFEGSLWNNCKIFISSYKAMEFAIILTTISKNGIVTAEEFLTMINAINEKLDHNRVGMKAVREFAEGVDELTNFAEIMLDVMEGQNI